MDEDIKLTYFSPLPPTKSGISDFSADLLPALSDCFDLTVYSDGITGKTSAKANLSEKVDFPPPESEEKHDNRKISLYQIGNNKLHGLIYLRAVLSPGIAMLHEYVLHHLVKAITIGIEEDNAYTHELSRYYGDEGSEIARLVHTGRAASETLFFHYPLFERIAERSQAIITTTNFSKQIVEKRIPGKQVFHVPLPIKIEKLLSKKEDEKKELGLQEMFTLGVFGLISEAKEIDLILKVLAHLKKQIPKIRLLLIGRIHPECNLQHKIESAGLQKITIAPGFVNNDKFKKYLAATDLCINLRYPSGGESSAAQLDFMAAGKAIIVPEYQQFLEFPSETVIRIPLGRDKSEILKKTIVYLNKNPEMLKETGEHAIKYIRANHEHKKITGKLSELIKSIHSKDLPPPTPLTPKEEQMFKRLYKKVLRGELRIPDYLSGIAENSEVENDK